MVLKMKERSRNQRMKVNLFDIEGLGKICIFTLDLWSLIKTDKMLRCKMKL